MELKPSTSRERTNLFIETLINETDKVTKVSRHSVLSGLATGVAKVAGKSEKDIALALSELFPDLSFGENLDRAAKNLGISGRLGPTGSSTYVRVSADPGTVYLLGVHQFNSTEGPVFELEQNETIGAAGFAYIKVKSIGTGKETEVSPLTISKMNVQPSGHKYVINEVRAMGGMDAESDDQFRIRIKQSGNLYARNTLAMIEQLCIKINPKVLRLFNYGVNHVGKIVLAVATQDGSNLTNNELENLLNGVGGYLALSDAITWGNKYIGVVFRNVEYQPIDISFRIVLDGSVTPDEVRKEIQISISKYLDFRTFDPTRQRVEWDNLLEIIKKTSGVKYVPDQYFYPQVDIGVHTYKLPRLRGFLMLNTDGTIISNLSGTLSPVYYPSEADFSYQQIVLNQL